MRILEPVVRWQRVRPEGALREWPWAAAVVVESELALELVLGLEVAAAQHGRSRLAQ